MTIESKQYNSNIYEIFLDDHLYQKMDNFLDAFDMDPILDKPFILHQFDLVGIAKFEELSRITF